MQLFAESLRVSVFTAVSLDYREVPVIQWWNSVAHADPEQYALNTAVAQAMAEGPYSESRLAVIASAVGRVDWSISPTSASSPSLWPSIGVWPNCIAAIAPAISNWLTTFSWPITRLAFGATVATSVADRETGYRKLESALTEVQLKLPADVADVLFQFNRPLAAASGPSGMWINRLARWGVARLAPIYLHVGGVPAGLPAAPSIGATTLRIELDFNSPAEWTQPVTTQQASTLLQEMQTMSVTYLSERLQ